MLSFLWFFVFSERAGYLKQKGDEGTERLHPSRRRKNATEDDNNLPHMLASWSSQTQGSRSTMSDNRKRRIRSKMTDEDCTKKGWMEIVFAQEEAKQNKPHIVYRNLSSTHAASKPIKADVIQCAHSISAGGRRGHIGRGSAL